MATALNRRHQTLEEFLAWEREQSERYERVSGVIRMMTGGRSTITGSHSMSPTRSASG